MAGKRIPGTKNLNDVQRRTGRDWRGGRGHASTRTENPQINELDQRIVEKLDGLYFLAFNARGGLTWIGQIVGPDGPEHMRVRLALLMPLHLTGDLIVDDRSEERRVRRADMLTWRLYPDEATWKQGYAEWCARRAQHPQ